MWLLDHFPTPSTYHFLFFYAQFLVFKLLFISFITPFSHPFRIIVFYELFISLRSIDCYIQFHFWTCSNSTSASFSNSFNFLFFIFLSRFLVFNLIFISFMIHISHPFRILVFYELFISLCSIDCYIQFCLLTCYNTTSWSFSNSFNIPFFIFLCYIFGIQFDIHILRLLL